MDISIAVILLVTVTATVSDLKYKIVPNYINYFLIIFGLGAGLITSLLTATFWPILLAIIGAAVFYAIGAALYYTGMWGGGDAKLLTGYGATMASFPAIVAWPFLVTLFLNILFCGAIVGVISSLYLIYKHKKKFVKELRRVLHKLKKFVVLLYVLFGVTLIVFFTTKSLLILLLWALTVVFFYFFLSLKAIETVCMFRKIAPKDMQEGDWVLEPVKVKGKIIYEPEKAGISIAELKKLQKLASQGKIKTVTIKDGIQYIPAFLLALILNLLKIDLMFLIFSRLIQ